MAEEVKLLGAKGSLFACRVEIALKLKGIDFKYLAQDLKNKSNELLKHNPIHKEVPVLLHNEKPVLESFVIVEYIDEAWKGFPILPSDPYQRAQARFWSKFIDDKCLPAFWKVVSAVEEKEKSIGEALEVLQFLENELKSKFFGGHTLGLVDIAACVIAFWIPTVQEVMGLQLFTADKFPKLYEWSEEFVNHPIVKHSLPSKDELVAFFNYRRPTMTASK